MLDGASAADLASQLRAFSRRGPAVAARAQKAAVLVLEGRVHFMDRHFETALVDGREDTYSVNLVLKTCTCPDWQQARAPLVRGHRCCKHLIAAFMAKLLASRAAR